MARGDDDARVEGAGRPGPASAAPPDDVPADRRAETVPAETLRAWDAAEARLFPLVMARPEEYERSLTLIRVLLGWLRDRCQDVPALLAESARGVAIIAEATGEPGDPGDGAARDARRPGDSPAAANLGDARRPGDSPAAANLGDARRPGDSPAAANRGAGLRGDLIAAAACAMRYRELAAVGAARRRLSDFTRASAGGQAWAVVEETGDPARAPYLPYHRVEAHVPSGRSLIISIEPDEALRAVWRLDEAELDPATGQLAVGAEIGSYTSAAEFDDALARARLRLG